VIYRASHRNWHNGAFVTRATGVLTLGNGGSPNPVSNKISFNRRKNDIILEKLTYFGRQSYTHIKSSNVPTW